MFAFFWDEMNISEMESVFSLWGLVRLSVVFVSGRAIAAGGARDLKNENIHTRSVKRIGQLPEPS